MGQWMADFCLIMCDGPSQNSNDSTFLMTKANHAVFLCRMEQIRDYTQTNLLDRVRRTHAQRHLPSNTQSLRQSQAFKKDRNTKPMPCKFLTKVLVLVHLHTKRCFIHTFVHVFLNGRVFQHADIECQNKKKATKTSKLGSLYASHSTF